MPVMLWYLDKNQEEISDCKCNKELTSVFYNWITDKHKPIYNICIAWDQWPDSTNLLYGRRELDRLDLLLLQDSIQLMSIGYTYNT